MKRLPHEVACVLSIKIAIVKKIIVPLIPLLKLVKED